MIMIRKLMVVAAGLLMTSGSINAHTPLLTGMQEGNLGRSQGEIALKGFKQIKAIKHPNKIDKCIYNMNTSRVTCYEGSKKIVFNNVRREESSKTGTPGH